MACPQGWRGGGRDPVPVVTSAPGHPQFTLTVFRPAASSGLGAVPSLWNKCQKSSPLSPPLLLCVSLALGSRGWTRLGGLPPTPPSPPLCPHPSGTGLAAVVGFAQGDGHSGTRGAGLQPQTSWGCWLRAEEHQGPSKPPLGDQHPTTQGALPLSFQEETALQSYVRAKRWVLEGKEKKAL